MRSWRREMANFYVSHLDRLNHTVTVSKASQNRAFIERRLVETKVGLVKSEDALRDFQTKNKTVAVEAQSKAMIEAAAMIQGQITAQEVQLEVLSSYLSRTIRNCPGCGRALSSSRNN